MSALAAEIGKGLAPARPARPIRAGERIHVVGAAGAGASAAASAGPSRGRDRHRVRPGRPVAVHGSADRGGDPARLGARGGARHDRAVARRAAGAPCRDQGTHRRSTRTTPSSSPPRAGHPYSSRGSSSSPTPPRPPASDWSPSPARTASRRRPAGSSTCWSAPAAIRRRSSARCSMPICDRRRRRAPRAGGAGPEFVVEADEYAGNFDPYQPVGDRAAQRGVGPPRRLRGRGRGSRRVRGVDPARAGRDARRQHARSGRRGRSSIASVTGRARSWRRTIGRAGRLRRSGLPGPANAANAHGRHRRRARSGHRRSRSFARAWPTIRGVGRRHGGQGRDRRRDRHRRLRPSPDGDRADARGSRGHATRDAACGPSTSRSPTTARRRCWINSPTCWRRPMRSRSPTSGPAATPTRRSRAPRHSPFAVSERRRASSRPRPGTVEATADYLAERVQPGDVVLVMGGGRSYVIAERLVELLTRRRQPRDAGTATRLCAHGRH